MYDDADSPLPITAADVAAVAGSDDVDCDAWANSDDADCDVEVGASSAACASMSSSGTRIRGMGTDVVVADGDVADDAANGVAVMLESRESVDGAWDSRYSDGG